MGQRTKTIALIALLGVAVTHDATAIPMTFVGSFSYYNHNDGVPFCGGPYHASCWAAFSTETGVGDPDEVPYRFYGYGSIWFTADSISNEILSSEIRIGNWTTTFGSSLVPTNSAPCSPPANAGIKIDVAGGSDLTFCNRSPGLSEPFPLITIEYMHAQPANTFRCSISGLGAYCGRLAGNGWAMFVDTTSLTPVPEPGTLALLGLGLLGLSFTRRRIADSETASA